MKNPVRNGVPNGVAGFILQKDARGKRHVGGYQGSIARNNR
jgi:hypothetical protein